MQQRGSGVAGGLERDLQDADRRPRVVAVAAIGMKLGNLPDRALPLLQQFERSSATRRLPGHDVDHGLTASRRRVITSA